MVGDIATMNRKKSVRVTQEEWYLKFEKAFPVADMWIVACAFIGAVGLLTGQNYGLLFSILAASSHIFGASIHDSEEKFTLGLLLL